jgi:4-diphosphocytidyl-2-C-methyl-D-erythritol kinase
MRVRRSGSGLEVLAPAKLNLFLEVFAKRNDGYHELETLMTPIAWYDTLSLAVDPTGAVSLSIEPSSGFLRTQQRAAADQQLPTGDTNLVVRAVKLLRERSGASLGARMHLVKRIPLAAGMGGGSSDAAAALAAANTAWELGWTHEQLASVAAELGSDVPFFLGRGPAICRGRGEIIEPLERLAPLHFVVAKPPVGLSTAEVYRACRPAQEPHSLSALVDALRAGRVGQAGRFLYNRLESAAVELCDWIARLRNEFRRFDCVGHQMSGSGTSYFGLCRDARHARRIAAALRGRGVAEIYAVAGCC